MAHAHFATSTKQCNEQAVAPHGRVGLVGQTWSNHDARHATHKRKRGRSRMDLNATNSCACLGNLAQPGSSGVRFGSGKKAQMLRQSGLPPVSHGAVPRRPCSHTRSVMPAHARSRRQESKHMAERPASEPQD